MTSKESSTPKAVSDIEVVLDNDTNTDSILNKIVIRQLVNEIVAEIHHDNDFNCEAITALTDAADHYLVEVFEKANLLSQQTSKQTIQPTDLRLAVKFVMKNNSSIPHKQLPTLKGKFVLFDSTLAIT